MPSRRQERVAKRVMQELVEAIRELKNVNLGFITITKCEVAPDLRHAKVFVSVWGDEEQKKRTMETLHRNASRLKGVIGRPLGTKVVPSLHFEFDESVANADQMSQLIRDARKSDVNPNPLTPEEAAALAAQPSGKGGALEKTGETAGNPFDAARMDVEEELWGDDDAGYDDDPDWKPINLDELPEDDDKDEDSR